MELDPERRLALAYAPAPIRPALEALWRLDATFAGILATGTQPLITQMRLAWWREALERLDSAPPPPEPLLQALATHVLPTVRGAELAAMEEGWLILLSEGPLTAAEQADYAGRRGGLLFTFSARLLGVPAFPVALAGEIWALADLGRHNRRSGEAKVPTSESQVKWPRRLRPLGMLAVLARRDLDNSGQEPEKPGSPARIWRMIRHRLTGK